MSIMIDKIEAILRKLRNQKPGCDELEVIEVENFSKRCYTSLPDEFRTIPAEQKREVARINAPKQRPDKIGDLKEQFTSTG